MVYRQKPSNVEEWTCSQYEDKYRGNEQACVKSAKEIVLRGGSGIDFRLRLRSAFRNSRKPSERFRFVGFRVVRPR
ncbi:MAG: SUMF1/EgtB/PvdO family nonheme iron enzyme [Pseudomonadota bacterium]